jgi:hypothetical protein
MSKNRKRFIKLEMDPPLPFGVKAGSDLIMRHGRDVLKRIASDLAPLLTPVRFQPCLPYRPEAATAKKIDLYFVTMEDRRVVALIPNKEQSGENWATFMYADDLGITLGVNYEAQPGHYRDKPI